MGPYLAQPITQKTIAQGSTKQLQFISAQMQGWRKTMQDACIHQDLQDGNSIFGVFDGHGGSQVSKYVAATFVKLLKQLKFYKQKKYKQALHQIFKLMDEKLQSQQVKQILNTQRGVSKDAQPISKATGCTANVVLITPQKLIVANAGDSRSVLCRSGKAVQLSFDHKPQSQQQKNRIQKAGGTIYMGRVNGGLNLTRSFGDFDYKTNKNLPYDQQMITCNPDIKQFNRQVKKDEYIIVGCDGIWQKYVQNSQGLIDLINQLIKKQQNKKNIMQKMLDQLIASDTTQGIGCDNMTAVLIKFK